MVVLIEFSESDWLIVRHVNEKQLNDIHCQTAIIRTPHDLLSPQDKRKRAGWLAV